MYILWQFDKKHHTAFGRVCSSRPCETKADEVLIKAVLGQVATGVKSSRTSCEETEDF